MTPRTASDRHTSIEDLIQNATRRLRKSKAIDHWRPALAREDAEELLAIAIGADAFEEIDVRETLKKRERRRFDENVKRRFKGEPVAMIRGYIEFAEMKLGVRPGVFVPRGSSELLAETAVAALRKRRDAVAVDVACGAAPIALAVAKSLPRAEVWGVDIAKDAVELARANAKRNHIANVRFRVSDLLDGLPKKLRGRVGAFTIHPPYVRGDEVDTLPKEIRAFEPRHTLTDNSHDGLGLVRGLAEQSPEWLAPRGHVIVEVAPYLSRSVQAVLRKSGYEVTWTSDPGGITRVVIGRHTG
jgi:release factor glutamine methyltransferase